MKPSELDDVLRSVGTAVLNLQRQPDGSRPVLPDSLTLCRQSEMNGQMDCIGTTSGVVDLRTGRLLPPEEGRQKLVTLSTGTRYAPGAYRADTAAGRAVRKLLAHLPAVDRKWLEEFLGFAMSGRPPGFGWLVGPAGSGKTTALEAVQSALGCYAFALPESVLEKRSGSTHTEGIERFTSGARLCVASDV